APRIAGVEHEAVGKRQPGAPVMIMVAGNPLLSIPAERHDDRRELLVEADAKAVLGLHIAVVRPEPDTVVPFWQRKRRRRIAHLTKGVQGIRETRRIRIALLNPETE